MEIPPTRLSAWIIAIILISHTSRAVGDDAPSYVEEESRLRNDLLRNYDGNVRPAKNVTSPVDVDVQLFFNHILGVDPRGSSLSLSLWVLSKWNDSRLSWNSSDYSDIMWLSLPTSQGLWVPDIGFFGSTTPQIRRNTDGDHVIIESSGKLQTYYIVEVKSHCYIDIRNFPFDEHECKIYASSYNHDTSMIRTSLPGMANSYNSLRGRHNAWDVYNITANTTMSPSRYVLDYTLSLRRVPSTALHMYVLPPVVISMLVPFAFLLKTSGAQRCILGTGAMVNLCYFIGNFDWLIPTAQGEMPRLGIFYVGSLVVAVVAFMVATCVAVIADWASGKSPPHHFVTRVIGDWLAMPLMVTRIPQGNLTVGGGSDGDGCDLKVKDEKDQSGEWRHLARVLDRAFFVLFSFVLAILILACLV